MKPVETDTFGYAIGTWLRFMRDGRLVIGVVSYSRKHTSWTTAGPWEYTTDAGVVHSRDVLEAR